MHPHANGPRRTIVPTLRYQDVAAAIDWLCKAFGFERHLVVPGEDDGAVRYAELIFGGGMIMLGPVADSAVDKLMQQPADAGGAETQICYLFVEDVATHCAQAKAAGAEIVLDIEEAGGRGYSCRDPEGHIWNFGTYDPWKRHAAEAGKDTGPVDRGTGRRANGFKRGFKRAALVSGLLVALAGSATVVDWATGASGLTYGEGEPGAAAAPADATAKLAQEQLARAREGREAAEKAVKEVREQLGQERLAREAAERGSRAFREQLAQERQVREAAERAAREAREQLSRAGSEQTLKDAQALRERLGLAERAAAQLREELAAERSEREVREQLEKESAAKEEAERNRKAAEKAAKEKAAKEATEHAAKEAAEQTARAARERRERSARPPPRPRVSAEPKPLPPINWQGG